MSLAVLTFNREAVSSTHLMKSMGLQPGKLCATHFHRCDVLRIKRAEKRRSLCEKKRRKAKRRLKAAAQKLMLRVEGGPSYQAG